MGGSLSLSDDTDAATLLKEAAKVQGLVDLARHAGIDRGAAGAAASPSAIDFAARRAVLAEEDQPQRRARLPRRRAGPSSAAAAARAPRSSRRMTRTTRARRPAEEEVLQLSAPGRVRVGKRLVEDASGREREIQIHEVRSQSARRARHGRAHVEAVGPADVERVREPARHRRRQRPHDAGAARRDPRSAVQRRRAARRSARKDVRRPGRGQRAGDARSARAADPADHRADEGVGLHLDAARPRAGEGAPRAWAAAAKANRRSEVRGHRQGARFSRLPRAARSARLGRPQQRRPPRHARSVDRHRDQRRAEAVRVRRRDEPRCHRDDPECREAAAWTAAGRRPGAQTDRPGSTSTIRT